MDRNVRSRLRQHRSRRAAQISRRSKSTESVDYFNVLTSEKLIGTTEALMPAHRERVFAPTVTLSMFMRQALEADGSCQKVVDGWAAQRVADGLSPCSTSTAGYCRARWRLPESMISGLVHETGRQLCALAPDSWRVHGRTVKLVDGTGISMPDTKENQERYPQPSTQAPGVGFPLARLVMVICLATGAAIDAATGRFSGKGHSELGLYRRLAAAFQPDDVMLADALYCNYFLIATMVKAGVDVLFEQNGARNTDFRRGRRLGRYDHLVSWPKPKARPNWMTPEEHAAFADQLQVREVKVNGQILVTTMRDEHELSKRDLAELYAERWHVELDLRNLKTTMGMDVLRCQTPEMIDKEMWVHLLAYNVIRLLMAQAAFNAYLDPRDLSFKHTVQMCLAWGEHNLNPTDHSGCLFVLIAQRRVANRPGRIEPRMKKRRPKPYPWLKEPRAIARRRIGRFGHA